jgi:RND family efflux transporter MFP subunit
MHRPYVMLLACMALVSMPALAEVPAASAGASAALPSQAAEGIAAFTEPSLRADLAFAIPSSEPAVVREVLVKEGDRVTKGQPLVVLDDRGVRAQLEAQQLEAKSPLRIDAAVADLEVKKLELVRFEKIFKSGGGNDNEVETARAAVLLREIQVEIERLTQKIRAAQAEQLVVRAEQMTMTSPIDGTVERLDLLPGEVPEFGKPTVIVVSNTPLWINAFIPAEKSNHLRAGMEVPVVYGDNSPTPGKKVAAKIIYLSNVVDPASGSRRIKLELANPDLLPSGLDVTIHTTPVNTAAAGQ